MGSALRDGRGSARNRGNLQRRGVKSMAISVQLRSLMALAAAVSAVALAACTRPVTTGSRYDSEPQARDAKLDACSKLYAPASDRECRAAMDADARAVAAEHGPPFHGHNVKWYRAHQLQTTLEAGYCDKQKKRATDPDCVAAEEGLVRF